MHTIDLELLQDWVGRREVADDVVSEFSAAALAATLDHPEGPIAGAALPPLWHWLYFKPLAAQAQLDSDGHPLRGGFLPPVPLPRRMWAGGRLTFLGELRIGNTIRRETEITGVTVKTGREGPLVFLSLRHRVFGPQGLAVEEDQDIVYRTAPTPGAPAPRPRAPETRAPDWRDEITPDEVLLFRYSALTFNSHRIHYDRPYAQSVEGYPGLVVHGPLLATLLLDTFTKRFGGVPSAYQFSAKSALFAGRPIALCGKAGERAGEFDLWAETPDRQVGMMATVQLDGV